ncbi:unnamed protein product [Schistocephalus solidus]|uniref:Rhodanese domain-containing protein n=1 Tax=Schistocephalus solidus TaxID=70667 RepID=A0A183TJB8_SCHSO|nr:unnamed protein product [Schistocephalus solidus]
MRPLYIAKSIQELEKYSDINSIRIDNSKIPELIFKCFSDADNITITRLEKSLSEHELPSWNHRNNVRLIVLVDEDTGEELIEHPEDAECFHLSCRNPLKIVYDALVTYNAEKDQLSPTVFLAGGIKEFSKRYPTFVTILSSRKKPSAQGEQNKAAYPNFTDITYVGDNMLTDENIRSTPPEMPIYSNAGILPYSELSKTLKKISVDTCATDHNYDLPPNRIATSKKTDSEKSSEEVAYPPTVDRSNKPKSDAPSVPPPSYESLSDLLSDYTEAPPTICCSPRYSACLTNLVLVTAVVMPDQAGLDYVTDCAPPRVTIRGSRLKQFNPISSPTTDAEYRRSKTNFHVLTNCVELTPSSTPPIG